MTAEPPESPVTEGVCSLEVRWFFPGQLETAVAEWFGRFPAETQAPGLGREPRCAVELTEVRTPGQDWWTLGFEATGPDELLRSALQATAGLVFAQALPGSVEPGADESRSYPEWLRQRSGAERYAAWKASDDRILMPADQR